MKKKIKDVLLSVFVAVLLGFFLGRYVFRSYLNDVHNELKSTLLYVIENGEYETIEDMRQDNSRNNYVYYKDNNRYKTVVGITKKYDNIEKIKNLYGDGVKVYEYYITNNLLDEKQIEYDDELANTSDMVAVREVVDSILELYRSDDSVKLIALS